MYNRPEHNAKGDPKELNFEGLEICISTNTAQRVDEKMGLFLQLSCLFPELWTLKYQKWLIFCIACTDASKKLVTVWAKHLSAPERSLISFRQYYIKLPFMKY